MLLTNVLLSVGHAFTALGSGIAMAAAILLTLIAWLSTNGQAIRIAFAVMVYEAFLLMDAIDPDPISNGLLVSDLALIGAAVLCGLALRRESGVEDAWRTSGLISTAVVIGCAIASLVPDMAPAASMQYNTGRQHLGCHCGSWACSGVRWDPRWSAGVMSSWAGAAFRRI